MILLKIKDKGMFIEIPGIKPFRSPGEVDISKTNINNVFVFLKKNGIQNFEIISSDSDSVSQPKNVNVTKKKKQPNTIPKLAKNDTMDEKFSKLEEMLEMLIEKDKDVDYSNLEQNTTKVTKTTSKPVVKKNKEPKIEELEDTFIPDIDISNIKIKGASNSSIKKDNIDLDNSADLLSRIMGQEE